MLHQVFKYLDKLKLAACQNKITSHPPLYPISSLSTRLTNWLINEAHISNQIDDKFSLVNISAIAYTTSIILLHLQIIVSKPQNKPNCCVYSGVNRVYQWGVMEGWQLKGLAFDHIIMHMNMHDFVQKCMKIRSHVVSRPSLQTIQAPRGFGRSN